jgi:Protein of unknown function DUF115
MDIMGTHISWDTLGVNPNIIAKNSARIKARVKPVAREDQDKTPVALVAYGASLLDTWEQIKDFKIIYTCSGAHRFLIDRGVIPTYHVDSDPRAYKADILGGPHPDVTYLIASNCHPTYFDKLELHKAKVKLWHIYFPEPQGAMQYIPVGDWVFTGGHTVGPRMFKMARLMGYTNLHFFGFDSSIVKGKTHATEHPNPPRQFFIHEHNGVKYLTDIQWLTHAKVLLDNLDRLPEVSYSFYGDGLQQAMAATHERVELEYQPMAFRYEVRK